jgi:hypothetical protein
MDTEHVFPMNVLYHGNDPLFSGIRTMEQVISSK